MSEEDYDIISDEEAAFAPVRFKLMRDITPEVYDYLQSVLEEVAKGDLCVVDDEWKYYCPHCSAIIPGLYGPKKDRPDLPPLPMKGPAYVDMEKLAETFPHDEACIVRLARQLLILLPPRSEGSL